MSCMKPPLCLAVLVLLSASITAQQQKERVTDFETGRVMTSPKVDETRAAMTGAATGSPTGQSSPNPTVQIGDKLYVLGVDSWDPGLEKALQQGRLVAIKIKGNKAEIEDTPGHTVTLPIVSHSKLEEPK
jgi:hypothetical protein